MQKLTLAILVAIVALAPALADAQTGSGSTPGTSSGGSSTPGMSGGSSGSGTTGSGGAVTTPGAPGRSTSSPSASPGGTARDFSKYTTKVSCEKAGGMWQAAQSSCEKK